MPRSFTRTGRWLLTAVTIGMPLAVLPVAAASAAAPPTLPPGYVTLVDDTGRITVSVPPTWTDIDTVPSADPATGVGLATIAAAPNLQSFTDTFDSPGVRFIAFPFTATPQTLIDTYGLRQGCASTAVQPYSDGVFTGLVQIGTACGTGAARWNMVVASPASNAFTAAVQVQSASPADQQAFDVVLASFNAAPTGAVPATPTVPGVTAIPAAPTVPAVATVATAQTVPVVPVTPTVPVVPVAPTVAPVPLPAPTAVPGPTTPGAQGLTITDDTGRITVQVPASWNQTLTAPTESGQARIIATTDISAPAGSVPSLTFIGGQYVDDTLALITGLAHFGEGCTPGEISPFGDEFFTGHLQAFTNCTGTGSFMALVVANPPSHSSTMTMLVRMPTFDEAALELILNSFNVTS